MGDVNIVQQQLPDPNQLYNQGKTELNNLREFKVGDGSSVFYTDKEGSRWGSIVFDDAKAWIKVDGTAKFKTASGQVLLSSDADDGNFINVINTALNTATQTILGAFTFEATDYAGAFKTGNITWNEVTGLVTGGTGIVMNARGIVGANAGVATFSIDATTGNATFAGTLAGASGTFGSITAGSISGVTITGSTITGSTIQTNGSGSGLNVRLNSTSNVLEFLYNGSQKGYLGCDSSGDVVLESDSLMWLTSHNNLELDAYDVIQMHYNADGGSNAMAFVSGSGGGTWRMALYDNGDLFLNGTDFYTTGYHYGKHKTRNGNAGKSGPNTYGFVTAVESSRAKFREFTVEDGLITSVASESGWS